MSWLHTYSGLTLGWLVFAIFVTGTLSFFRNEITFWMQPERHKANSDIVTFERALGVLESEAPNARQWTMTLPGPRNPTLGISWQNPQQNAQQNIRQTAIPNNNERRVPSDTDTVGRGNESNAGNAERRSPRRQGEGVEMSASAEGRPTRQGVADAERRGSRGNAERRTMQTDEGDEEELLSPRQSQNTLEQAQSRPQEQPQQQHGGARGVRLTLDPATGEKLGGRETAGGNFLYRFHFELYGMDRIWGRWIIGIATMLMFIAIVSGVIVHRNIFKDFFTFRPAKGKRSWLDAHNGCSVLSLPFHIMITFSGLLLFGNMMIPTAMQSAFKGDMDAYRQNVRNRMANFEYKPPAGERATMIEIAPLVAAAERTWKNRKAGSVIITNPNDKHAVIEVRQSSIGGSLVAGRSAAQSLYFDGVSGQSLTGADAAKPTTVQAISNVLILLHRGFFASPIPRWLLFLGGVGGSLMVATGLIMWRVARQKDQEKQQRSSGAGFRVVEGLNVTGIAGLMVAIGAYFWANRLIPADVVGRNDWEIRAFFIVWAITLIHAFTRQHKMAWVEQLAVAGILIGLLPLLNALTGGLALSASIGKGQWVVAGFDITALLMGVGLLYTTYRVYKYAPKTIASILTAGKASEKKTHEQGMPLPDTFTSDPRSSSFAQRSEESA
jgi:uncharacterized iron-regulated membrane protein